MNLTHTQFLWNLSGTLQKAELNLGQSMGCERLINKMAPGMNGGVLEVYRKQVNLSISSEVRCIS